MSRLVGVPGPHHTSGILRTSCRRLLVLLAWGCCTPLFAADAGPLRGHDDWFQPYEPSTIGITRDSDDDLGFLDVTLSLQLPLGEWEGPFAGSTHELGIGFTGRFGFYMGSERDSRPVIGKRLNPKLLWRLGLADDAARLRRCESPGEHCRQSRLSGRRRDPVSERAHLVWR